MFKFFTSNSNDSNFYKWHILIDNLSVLVQFRTKFYLFFKYFFLKDCWFSTKFNDILTETIFYQSLMSLIKKKSI